MRPSRHALRSSGQVSAVVLRPYSAERPRSRAPRACRQHDAVTDRADRPAGARRSRRRTAAARRPRDTRACRARGDRRAAPDRRTRRGAAPRTGAAPERRIGDRAPRYAGAPTRFARSSGPSTVSPRPSSMIGSASARAPSGVANATSYAGLAQHRPAHRDLGGIEVARGQRDQDAHVRARASAAGSPPSSSRARKPEPDARRERFAGARVQRNAPHRGVQRLRAAREQAADDPGEHVARARRRQADVAVFVAVERAVRRRDVRRRALERDDRAEPPRGVERDASPDRASTSSRARPSIVAISPGMRRQDRRGRRGARTRRRARRNTPARRRRSPPDVELRGDRRDQLRRSALVDQPGADHERVGSRSRARRSSFAAAARSRPTASRPSATTSASGTAARRRARRPTRTCRSAACRRPRAAPPSRTGSPRPASAARRRRRRCCRARSCRPPPARGSGHAAQQRVVDRARRSAGNAARPGVGA